MAIGLKPLNADRQILDVMNTIDERYYTSLNKAINVKSRIDFYSCVKKLSAMRKISIKRAYWILVTEN